MSTTRQKYPLDVQTFSDLREGGYLYVDKTDIIYKMANGSRRYIFLSRPRRFGKSLLISTLRSYFEGKKELFQGLAIEQLEHDWKAFPVLQFSMSDGKHMDPERLERYLLNMLAKYEKQYGINDDTPDPNVRFKALVEHIHATTGKKVVVLIDEYDAPLLDVMHEDEELPKLRKVMRNFYAPLKGLDPCLRFVFLTGITKFSQLSIFSELNNIRNVSMLPQYATICGITEEEMLTQCRPGIEELALAHGLTYDGAVAVLKKRYDGYHFTHPSPDIYNPYSLLNALEESNVDHFWFETATPTYLVELLRKYEMQPQNVGNKWVRSTAFDVAPERMTSFLPLFYQSGYLTIKDYDSDTDEYLLDIPNDEVRTGLMHNLLPYYVTTAKSDDGDSIAGRIGADLKRGDLNGALERLRDYLLTVPQTSNTNYEGHYQSLLYVILTLVGGYNVDVEVRTATGRVDMVARTKTTLYIIEIKIDKSAAVAMEQIDRKQYFKRFQSCGLPVVKVGLNFSTAERTLTDWTIEQQESTTAND